MAPLTPGLSSSETQSSPLSALSGVKILLIDDEPGVLRALTLVLQAMKSDVGAHNRPEDGLKTLFSGGAWDVIVCDLRMPGMSGLEVLTALRESGNKTPFILMSGHATEADVQEARQLGANGFLPKPFAPVQLAEEVMRFKTVSRS